MKKTINIKSITEKENSRKEVIFGVIYVLAFGIMFVVLFFATFF